MATRSTSEAKPRNTPAVANPNGNGTLAARLEEFRLDRGMTYMQLAASIGGVHYSTLVHAIADRRNFSKRIARKVERFLEGG